MHFHVKCILCATVQYFPSLPKGCCFSFAMAATPLYSFSSSSSSSSSLVWFSMTFDGKNWRVKSLCDWYLNPSKTFKCKSFSVFVDLFSLLTAENHFLDAHKMSPKIQLSLSLCRWLFSLQSSMWMNVEILPHDYAYIS